jgi:hypothetical protein
MSVHPGSNPTGGSYDDLNDPDEWEPPVCHCGWVHYEGACYCIICDPNRSREIADIKEREQLYEELRKMKDERS